jgi:hypothetical protein
VRDDVPPCTALPPAAGAATGARRWCEADGEHIDVRGLAPPQPLVAIVQLIESLPRTARVIVHHDRDPVLLYPELAERGWLADALPAPEGELRLLLHADDGGTR